MTSDCLAGTGVTVNAVYPGVVDTRLLRHSKFYKSWFSSIILKPFVWIFIKNPKQGSQPVLYAAIDPSIEHISGYLFGYDVRAISTTKSQTIFLYELSLQA